MHILLHICCANCAIYPVKALKEQGHTVTGYFFNHNIHPYQEYRRRLETTKEYADREHLPLIVEDNYALDDFLAHASADPQNRCDYCYRSRLIKTAQKTQQLAVDGFTTTLLYSRYQNHEAIIGCGRQLALEYRSTFHYEDYRTGWNEGIRISRQMGLYRQQYCGCIYSERDRYAPRSKLS